MTDLTEKKPKVLVVINPVAGFMNDKVMKHVIHEHFSRKGWELEFVITQRDTDLCELVRKTISKGLDLVVVAGGDGTIASVAAGMAGSSVPLGIVPSGTWNAIARHLMLPFLPIRALALMTGKHQVRYLDLMSIGKSVHAMNLSVGFSARVIKSTSREIKRKYGNLAYFKNLFKELFGIKLTRYFIEADGKKYHGKALEIMVANYGVVGLNMLESTFKIQPDDGKADVLIFKPRTLKDLPAMFWQAFVKREKRAPKFEQLQASSTLLIQTTPPMEVQADGDLVGFTPVTVQVLSKSVKVIVP
jgi:YegS/Rv2252/BmrU family lipid kinase